MISRRQLLLASAAMGIHTLTRPLPALGTTPFLWRNPGEDTYRGTAEQALDNMQRLGYLTAEARDVLLAKVRRGDKTVEAIPSDFRFPLMHFGSGYRENVIAATSYWPTSTTRAADVYRYEGEQHIYAVFRPHVCNNWSCAVIIAALDCLKPPGGCPECPEA